ncbi:hypothetical protein D3C86_819980 [compost metagenome]
MAHAQRVVHGDATGGLAVAVGIGRAERVDRGHLGIGRQGEADVDLAGLLGRAVGGEQLQVDQPAGIEAGAVGIGGEHLQARTLRVGHIAGLVGLEVAGARVHACAVHGHGEEALTGDGHVQAAPGLLVVALGELLGHVGQAHARTDRILGQAIAGGREQVGELGARFLEPGGVDVGDVVGGDVQVGIGCIDAGQGNVEAHGIAPGVRGGAAQLMRST